MLRLLINRMPTSGEVDIIYVDSIGLKEKLSPSPVHCLQEIENLLPELAKIKNEELLSTLNEATRALTSTPKSVEEFVDYLQFLQSTIDSQEETTSRYNKVTDMYRMAEDFNVSVE